MSGGWVGWCDVFGRDGTFHRSGLFAVPDGRSGIEVDARCPCSLPDAAIVAWAGALLADLHASEHGRTWR